MAEKRSDGEKRRMNQHQMRRLTSALSVLENKDRNKKMPKKMEFEKKIKTYKRKKNHFFSTTCRKKVIGENIKANCMISALRNG